MALPARKDWPEGAEEALRKARRAKKAKRVAVLLSDVVIMAVLAAAYLWALDCRSKALRRFERVRERIVEVEKICQELKNELACLSSSDRIGRAAARAGLRKPDDTEVQFLFVLPLWRERSDNEGPSSLRGEGRR